MKLPTPQSSQCILANPRYPWLPTTIIFLCSLPIAIASLHMASLYFTNNTEELITTYHRFAHYANSSLSAFVLIVLLYSTHRARRLQKHLSKKPAP